MVLRCPICKEKLNIAGKSYLCSNRHSFDIARQGYVNLLTVQAKHSLNPGDTRQQVLSRREFLETDTYRPILDAVIQAAQKLDIQGEILDIGCGEGYYAARLSEALGLPLTGLDISKEAVRFAAGKYKNCQWLCATASHIPVEDRSAGLVTSLFALTLPEEFHRVLKEGGYYFQVLAAQDHLLGLKSIIYDELLLKEKDSIPELTGFKRLETISIRFPFTVEGEQIQNLFSMTPHVFRVGKAGLGRLQNTQTLTDTASCVLNVFQRL